MISNHDDRFVEHHGLAVRSDDLTLLTDWTSAFNYIYA